MCFHQGNKSDALYTVLNRNLLVNVILSCVSAEKLKKGSREKWEKNVH